MVAELKVDVLRRVEPPLAASPWVASRESVLSAPTRRVFPLRLGGQPVAVEVFPVGGGLSVRPARVGDRIEPVDPDHRVVGESRVLEVIAVASPEQPCLSLGIVAAIVILCARAGVVPGVVAVPAERATAACGLEKSSVLPVVHLELRQQEGPGDRYGVYRQLVAAEIKEGVSLLKAARRELDHQHPVTQAQVLFPPPVIPSEPGKGAYRLVSAPGGLFAARLAGALSGGAGRPGRRWRRPVAEEAEVRQVDHVGDRAADLSISIGIAGGLTRRRWAIEEASLDKPHQVADRAANASILVAVAAEEGGPGVFRAHLERVQPMKGRGLGAGRGDTDEQAA